MMGFRPLHHPGRAIGAGILNGLFLLALPYGVTHVVLGILRSGGSDLLGGTALWTASDVAPLIAWLENLQRLILFVGGIATLLAALAAFFAKGTLLRMVFGLGRQGARFTWLAAVLAGGVWSLQFALPGSPIGGFKGFGGSAGSGSTAVQLTLDLSGIFALIYAALATTALYFVAEFILWWRNLRQARQSPAEAPTAWPPPPPGEQWGP